MVLVVLAVAAAACTRVESAAPPVTTVTATVPATASARGGSTGTTVAASCGQAATVFFATLADPAQVVGAAVSSERIERFARDVEDLRGQIIPALRADYEIVADAYTKAVSAMGSLAPAAGSVVTDRDRAEQVLGALDAPDVRAAHDRLRAYFESCLTGLDR